MEEEFSPAEVYIHKLGSAGRALRQAIVDFSQVQPSGAFQETLAYTIDPQSGAIIRRGSIEEMLKNTVLSANLDDLKYSRIKGGKSGGTITSYDALLASYATAFLPPEEVARFCDWQREFRSQRDCEAQVQSILSFNWRGAKTKIEQDIELVVSKVDKESPEEHRFPLLSIDYLQHLGVSTRRQRGGFLEKIKSFWQPTSAVRAILDHERKDPICPFYNLPRIHLDLMTNQMQMWLRVSRSEEERLRERIESL